MSSRSIDARDVEHSVIVTGDGNTIIASFGGTGAQISLHRRQTRAFLRRRPPRPGEPARELDLLLPDADTIPLHGRDDLLVDLRTWLDDPVDLSVHTVVGQAGSGKTRLAREICRLVDPGEKPGSWLAAFVSATSFTRVIDLISARPFVWDRPTLLVFDYAATAHVSLARWLDCLKLVQQTPKMRILLLERTAPENFGWWHTLRTGREHLFRTVEPVTLPGLADVSARRALIHAAQSAAGDLQGRGVLERVPAAGEDLAFDRLLEESRFGNPLNLVMAGLLACERTPLGALGLRRLDAAIKLAEREFGRLKTRASVNGVGASELRHIVGFSGLVGGLPLEALPKTIKAELDSCSLVGDAHGIATFMAEEYPATSGYAETSRLATIQPDLVGEAVIVLAFEGEPWLPYEAAPALRRAFTLGQSVAAQVLVRLVQDFAFALEERDSSPRDITRGKAVMSWLTDLAAQTAELEALLSLVFALPARTLVMREASTELGKRLIDILRDRYNISGDQELLILLACLLSDMAYRFSDLGRFEEALVVSKRSAALFRDLVNTYGSRLTQSFTSVIFTLANVYGELGLHREALRSAKEAVAICRGFAVHQPHPIRLQLANCLINLGTRLTAVGRHRRALSITEEAVGLLRALFITDCSQRVLDMLANGLNNLALRLQNLGRIEQALVAAQEAVQLRRGLDETNPDSYRAMLPGPLSNLSSLLRSLGRREEALAAAREAARISRALYTARPDAFRLLFARSLNNLSNTYRGLDRRDEALEAIEEAVSLLQGFALERPQLVLPLLASLLNNLASTRRAVGLQTEAVAAAEDAVRLCHGLVHGTRHPMAAILATAFDNLATALSDSRRCTEALIAAQKATDMYRALVSERPETFSPEFAASLNNLANRQRESGFLERAVETAREGLTLRRKLAMDRPKVFNANLASYLSNFADLLCESGFCAEALSVIDEALSLFNTLAVANPSYFGLEHSACLSIAAKLWCKEKCYERGIAALDLAIRRLQPTFLAYPKSTRGLMLSLVTSYRYWCGELGRVPNQCLLGPVEASLARLNEWPAGVWRSLGGEHARN